MQKGRTIKRGKKWAGLEHLSSSLLSSSLLANPKHSSMSQFCNVRCIRCFSFFSLLYSDICLLLSVCHLLILFISSTASPSFFYSMSLFLPVVATAERHVAVSSIPTSRHPFTPRWWSNQSRFQVTSHTCLSAALLYHVPRYRQWRVQKRKHVICAYQKKDTAPVDQWRMRTPTPA